MLHCGKTLLLTPAEMARADAASTVPVEALMAAAGRAVARAARRFGPCRTLVLCGPGHNGADGLIAGRRLAEEGWPVAVAHFRPEGQGRGPIPAGVAVVPFTPAEAARADLVIDAVFGAGFRGTLPETVAQTLASARRVLAIDVPSGLDGATGQPRGEVRDADLTVSFARLKPGHLLLPGRTLCGETILADIGLPDAALEAVGCRTWRNTPALWRLQPPGAADHKYTRGHLTILGGPAMTGAALLAAAAARRAGAGLVTIAAATNPDLYRAGDPGLIVTDAPLATLLEDPRRGIFLVGPGLSHDAARAALPPLLAAGREIVADADALTAFEGDPAALRGCTVLTPHAGEFARLFGPLGDDRLAATRAAAAHLGAVVLLKGSDTIIAHPDGDAAINDNAPPALATAGAGDVLAGIIAALLAQSLAPWDATCAATWLHGRAAELAGPGLIAEDIAPNLSRAVQDAVAISGRSVA